MRGGDEIEWSVPWLDPYRAFAFAWQVPDWPDQLSVAALERQVTTASGFPVRFVSSDDAGPDRRERPYETHIAETGRVPTRNNLHDFFNALVWLSFPKSKAALNQVQSEVIAREGIGGRRGPIRDAGTQIDESGLLLASTDDEVFTLLAEHRWHELLVTRRSRWGRDIWPIIFGHGLLEQLVAPFKGLTAAVVPLLLSHSNTSSNLHGKIDAAAAQFLNRSDLHPKLLLRLPVSGIPGWSAANENPKFYHDTQVFRPMR